MAVTHPLSVKLIGRTELGKMLQEDAVATAQSQTWKARQPGWQAMGFSSGAPQATSDRLMLLSRTVAGLYHPETKTLYVVGEHARSASGGIHLNPLGTLGDEVTLAHEVIHALQHLHYPDVFEQDKVAWQQQTDASLALQAAKEGDASLWAAQSLASWGTPRTRSKFLLWRKTIPAPSPMPPNSFVS